MFGFGENLKTIKMVISSRVYYSSFADKIMDTFLEDTSYTLVNTIITPTYTTTIAKYSMINDHVRQIEFAASICVFLCLISYLRTQTEKSTKQLEPFVECYNIRRNTNRFLFIFFMIFTKNVDSAI